MLTLFGRTNSSNVMKVMWLLDELALAHRRIDAGGAFAGTDTAEYRAMSPLGLVPALRDGDLALFESNAILRYLCRAHAPHSPLYPAEPAACAPIDAWLDVQQTTLGANGRLFWQVVRAAPDQRDPAAIARTLAEAGQAWAVLDGAMARRDYIAAPHLTIADMAFGPSLHRWFAMPVERPELPSLRAWYDRLAAHPAYARSCMVPLS